MINRINTTWISLGFAGLLTAGKFLFYYLSGSVAVLSEAWHSFSDIATSLVILVSLYHARALEKQEKSETQHAGTDDSKDTPKGVRAFFKALIAINHELKISMTIGAVLLAVSGSILWNVLANPVQPIAQPLVTGIFFLIFSGGSYLLYRVQTGVGKEEKSAALHADGIHSRADMMISLLTASSLFVFYYFNINLDQYVGGLIAVIILVFALEILINSGLCLARKQTVYLQEVTCSHIVASLFSQRLYAVIGEGIGKIIFPSNNRAAMEKFRRSVKTALKTGIGLILFAGMATYLSTCIYVVDTGQQGLKLRFGKIVNKTAPQPPGLYFKLSWPFETAVTINTGKIRTLAVGNRIPDSQMLIWSREHGDKSAFISGDNNLFLPYASVHYKVKNPVDYYIHPGKPEKLIQSMTLSLLTREFAGMTFYALALDDRKNWINRVTKGLQTSLDDLDCGIEVIQVFVQDIHPPTTVSPSFEQVVAALQNKEKLINQALAFKNKYLPKTRGQAYKSNRKAQIYVDEKKQRAIGEAANYKLRLEGYQKNPEVIGRLMYFKTVGDALKAAGSRTLLDPRTGITQKEVYNEKFLLRLDRR